MGMGSPPDCPGAVRVYPAVLPLYGRRHKQLVKVAHTVEHQVFPMLLFDAQVLLHHGGVFAQVVGSH